MISQSFKIIAAFFRKLRFHDSVHNLTLKMDTFLGFFLKESVITMVFIGIVLRLNAEIKYLKKTPLYVQRLSLFLLMWRAVTLPKAPRRLNIPLHQMLASVPRCNYAWRLGLGVLSWFGYKLRIILYSSLLHVPSICKSLETRGPHWLRHVRKWEHATEKLMELKEIWSINKLVVVDTWKGSVLKTEDWFFFALK